MDTLTQVLSLIWESLQIFMIFLYDATWSILAGVLVTAILDVFVNKGKIANFLGGRDLKSITAATAAGAVSSACTFGAVTVGQSLFKKGASVISTFAFSLAATNLVFELGILIYVILGPAYLAAELISGILLIAIMYPIVLLTLPSKTFENARKQLREQDSGEDSEGPGEHGNIWYRIADRYFFTIGRIYKSVIYGFLIAGFIIAFVPASFWSALFPETTSFSGVVMNGILGVLAGVFSFIGSIGIVPFAAALGAGGVAFAGVIGIIIADLITIPVLAAWKNFIGWKATWYLAGVFYIAMVISSISIHYIFTAFDWLPGPITTGEIVTPPEFGFNWRTIITITMILITVILYWVKSSGVQREAEV